MKHLPFLHSIFRTKSRKDDSKATQHSAETQLVDKNVAVKKAKVGRPRKKNPEDISEAPVKVKPRTRGKKDDGKYNKPIEYKRILISGRLLDAANQEIINVLLNEKRMLSYNDAICRLVGFKNTK